MGASTAEDDTHQVEVACTYEHCNEKFATVKDMQRHKANTDLHYYCKKCDIDFDSDLKHIMHRVVTGNKHSMDSRSCSYHRLTITVTCPECGADVSTHCPWFRITLSKT